MKWRWFGFEDTQTNQNSTWTTLRGAVCTQAWLVAFIQPNLRQRLWNSHVSHRQSTGWVFPSNWWHSVAIIFQPLCLSTQKWWRHGQSAGKSPGGELLVVVFGTSSRGVFFKFQCPQGKKEADRKWKHSGQRISSAWFQGGGLALKHSFRNLHSWNGDSWSLTLGRWS